MYVYIIRRDVQEAEAFVYTRVLSEIFSDITASAIISRYFEMKGSIAHQRPTEWMSFYFRCSELGPGDENLYDKQIQCAVDKTQTHTPTVCEVANSMSGWSPKTLTSAGEEARVFALCLSWHDLDTMHGAKHNSSSMLINTLCSLKEDATLGTETALFAEVGMRENRSHS